MNAESGEVEGKAFVGGTVTGNGFQVGFGLFDATLCRRQRVAAA